MSPATPSRRDGVVSMSQWAASFLLLGVFFEIFWSDVFQEGVELGDLFLVLRVFPEHKGE